MFEKFRLTLTGAASHSFGRKTYVRGKPVVSDDQAEVSWAMKTGRFKVEPVEEAEPEQAPAASGVTVVIDSKKIAEAVADGSRDPAPESEPDETTAEPASESGADPPATEPESPAPDGRTWSDDALQALLTESIRVIEPRLAELTVPDLERLRELEEAEPDTRKTLLDEIDQELRKKK